MNTKDLCKLLEREGYIEVYSDYSYPLQGTWIREVDGPPDNVFDVIQVTDLGNACGADGQTLVEAKSLSFGFARNRSDWLGLFSSMDTKRKDSNGENWLATIARDDKSLARLLLAYDFVHYGLSDPAGHGQSWWVAINDRIDEKEYAREHWTSNRVYGWGYTAIKRALDNALSTCGGFYHSSAYHPTYDGMGTRNPSEMRE